MNTWKTIVLAGATLALAAPVASASYDRMLPAKATHAKFVKITKKSHHGSAAAKKIKGNGSGRVIVITVPALSRTQPVPADPSLECLTTGSDCTPEQACNAFGMDCAP